MPADPPADLVADLLGAVAAVHVAADDDGTVHVTAPWRSAAAATAAVTRHGGTVTGSSGTTLTVTAADGVHVTVTLVPDADTWRNAVAVALLTGPAGPDLTAAATGRVSARQLRERTRRRADLARHAEDLLNAAPFGAGVPVTAAADILATLLDDAVDSRTWESAGSAVTRAAAAHPTLADTARRLAQ